MEAAEKAKLIVRIVWSTLSDKRSRLIACKAHLAGEEAGRRLWNQQNPHDGFPDFVGTKKSEEEAD